MKKVFFIISALFSVTSLTAQETHACHSDEMHYQLVQDKPNLLPVFEQKRQVLEAFTKNFKPFQAKSGPYIIPIVFHVIHTNGVENISEDQIKDGIKQLNEQFNKRNADTSITVAAFKGIAADVQVEFRLAKLDPDGKCTNGITRTYSTLSNGGYHDVKSLVHWPREKYLNVYVCKDAAGLAGHALMPPVADTLPDWDGIVMKHSYVGTIGTSQPLHKTVLSHEVGHYLNLYHIWGGNNVPNFYYLPVASAGNCAYDDEVDDTPNTIGWQTCNTGGSSCGGGLDNVQNYMDYSYCSTMFTEGQKTRIHAALNSPIAQRNNLWTNENLIATGVLDVQPLCHADFEIQRPYFCAGDTVTVFDRSYHGVTTRTWNIPTGTIVAQQDSIVKVIFTQEGKHTIALTVSDGTNTLTVSKEDVVEILPSSVTKNYLIEDFEYPSSTYRTVLLNANNTWQFTNYAATGENGYWVDNFEKGENTYEFDLRPINLVGVTNPSVIFDRAFARISGSPFESLEIKASNNCGATWNTIRSFSTASGLKTVATDLQEGPYTTPNQEDWASISSFVIPAGYRKEHTMLRFSFLTKGYNNLFVDNINVGAQAELSTTILENNLVSIYPNPAKTSFTISNAKDIPLSVSIYDITGKLIDTHQFNNGLEHQIDIKHLRSGYFLVKITVEGKEMTKRLIVVE